MESNSEFINQMAAIRHLSLLQELERNPVISQRELSRKFGIALGVTNACLRSMAQNGWILRRDLDHRKSGYFLTPKGIAEGRRLTSHLMTWRVQHYVALKEIVGRRLVQLQNAGIVRIAFYGVSDEMEVALAALQRTKLKLVGILEDEDRLVPQVVFGYKIEPVSRVNDLRLDSVLITSFMELEAKRERLEKLVTTRTVSIHDICR